VYPDPLFTIVTELVGGMTNGLTMVLLLVTVIDKYVDVLFRKTQNDPVAATNVGNPNALQPEFVML
jgi:hypothetical protein